MESAELEHIELERVFLPVKEMTDRELAEETLERLRVIGDAFMDFAKMDLSSMLSGMFSGGNAKGALRAALGRKRGNDSAEG
jgi:hypothetical protein